MQTDSHPVAPPIAAATAAPIATAEPQRASQPSRSERRTRAVALITAAAMVGEIGAGWWFNSMALLADGWHMGTHAAAIGLAALAYAMARRYRDDRRFAYGTWKIEVLAGFVSALTLMGVAATMVWASVERLLEPQPIRYVEALVVTVLGLAINVVCVFLLGPEHSHGHSKGHTHDHMHAHDHAHSHAHEDLNLRAAYLHVLADAATSVLAIVALLGGMWLSWAWLDPVMGLVGAALVARWSWGLIFETARSLLDCDMHHPLAADVERAIRTEAPWSEHVEVLELRLLRVSGTQFALVLKLRSNAPWIGSQQVHSFLARFRQIETATVEICR